MRKQLSALRAQRTELLARAGAEREQLARYVTRAETATVWLDRVVRLLEEAKRRPFWFVGGVAALIALRPKRALRLVASGWSLWQATRSLRSLWRRLGPITTSLRSMPSTERR